MRQLVPICTDPGWAYWGFYDLDQSLPFCSHLSARTILVLVTFSIVNFVLPPIPAILPIALDKWSPFSGLTKRKETDENNGGHSPISPYHQSLQRSRWRGHLIAPALKSPALPTANTTVLDTWHTIPTSTSNPSMNALTKSAAFWMAPGSVVYFDVWKIWNAWTSFCQLHACNETVLYIVRSSSLWWIHRTVGIGTKALQRGEPLKTLRVIFQKGFSPKKRLLNKSSSLGTFISTFFVLRLSRICSLRWSTMGV